MPMFRGDAIESVDLPGRRSGNPLSPELGAATGVSMRVVEVPPGPRTPHRHPHTCEVIYVAAGEGRVWEGDEASAVGPGDVVLVETGVAHATVCTGASSMQLVCFFPHSDVAGNTEELDGPLRS